MKKLIQIFMKINK